MLFDSLSLLQMPHKIMPCRAYHCSINTEYCKLVTATKNTQYIHTIQGLSLPKNVLLMACHCQKMLVTAQLLMACHCQKMLVTAPEG